jgi:hypothetical protein
MVFENFIMGFHISIDNIGFFSPMPTLFLTKNITLSTVYKLMVIKLQMARKQGGLLLRKELDNLSFLQSYPEVQKHFLDASCMTYVEKL